MQKKALAEADARNQTPKLISAVPPAPTGFILQPRGVRRAFFMILRNWDRSAELTLVCCVPRERPMRTITYALALALGLAFAGPSFAGDPTNAKTKVECQRAGGMWDVKTNSCLRGLAH